MKKVFAALLVAVMMLSIMPLNSLAATSSTNVQPKADYMLYEDFEGSLEGWSSIDADNDGYGWSRVSAEEYFEVFEGSYAIASASYDNEVGVLTPDNWLVSPAFTVESDAELSPVLTWHAVGQDSSYYAENYSVYVLTDGTIESAEELYTGTSTATWKTLHADLSEYVGKEINIAFRHHDITDMFVLNIDLITVALEEVAVPVDPADCLIYEDFEDALEGWDILDEDGDGFEWDLIDTTDNSLQAYEGKGFIKSSSFLNDEGELTPDNWLISPAFTADATTVVEWFAKAQDADWADENYSVYVLTDGTIASAEEVFNGMPTGDWEQYTADLSKFAGEEIKIAFRHFDVTDMYWLDIDLITVRNLTAPDPIAVTGVNLDKTEVELEVGATETLVATVEPENAANKDLVWTSSNEEVATVADGVVTAVAEGEAVITVKTVDGEFTAECKVTVKGSEVVAVTGIKLDKEEVELEVGATETLVATVEPENATNKDLVWTSSNEEVATVAEGVVTAVAEGEAVITVKTVDGEFTAECKVTVKAAFVQYYGDMNKDGKVNTGDAVILLKYAAEMLQLTDEELGYADADENGTVNTGDAVKVLRIAAELDEAKPYVPVELPQPEEPTDSDQA